MLKRTFCHIPGISISAEQRLWSSGIHSWDALSRADGVRLPRKAAASLMPHIERSFEALEEHDPNYFAELLPSNQHWRLFSDFRRSIAYLDIETTGLGYQDAITTIAVYDGQAIRCYVRDRNLDDFKRDIREYALIVTYNGKCFDVPFIESHFGINMNQAHIDLRYVLKGLGYTGGLKGCERKLGLDRKDLADVDGYFAVLLWRDFIKNRNARALETLLAYNIQDVVNLETLLVMAYNMKLEETPFRDRLRLKLPAPPGLPYEADRRTINRIKGENLWMGGGFTRWR
ncbi:MAG: ribonuclease H-like domain-containing protein [Blastocatellia bacterium]|nr:ribonuclease H-like domain-containing protein [Blastocatellia bacterium]